MVRGSREFKLRLCISPSALTLIPIPQYATPVFRGAKPAEGDAATGEGEKKQSNHVQRILTERKKDAKIEPALESRFKQGRLFAVISSRPGQSGRCDGYVLEGKELEVSMNGGWISGMLADDLMPPVLPAKDEPPKGQARCLSVSRLSASLSRAACLSKNYSTSCIHSPGCRRKNGSRITASWLGLEGCLCRRGIACLGRRHVHTVLMMI